MDAEIWNRRYQKEEFVYGKRPNDYLKEQLDGLPVGKILLPGEGEGRNALYAALKGWQVEAFDQSESGKQKAVKLALENKVKINYKVADVRSYPYLPEYYEAVAVVFLHLPSALRKDFHQQLASSLKPGGTLIMEVFHKQQILRSSGGPKDADMLYTEEELLADFNTLQIITLSHTLAELNEGPLHKGTAEVIRLLAKKI